MFDQPTELTGKIYLQYALNELQGILQDYCASKQNCSLDNNTKKNINAAISLISTALGYFDNDGNHLQVKKGLSFYDNITTAVNDIYAYFDEADFGEDIDQALEYLIEGTYKITVIARDDANTELGKAIDEAKQDNYVYIFNHLTNAWKFSMNILGANLKKDTALDNNSEPALPTQYGLGQNYPNPFNPTTRIDFQLPENKHVSLKIYYIRGNLVTTLVDGDLAAGYHSAVWDGGNFASGVYFYKLTTDAFVATRRLVLLK